MLDIKKGPMVNNPRMPPSKLIAHFFFMIAMMPPSRAIIEKMIPMIPQTRRRPAIASAPTTDSVPGSPLVPKMLPTNAMSIQVNSPTKALKMRNIPATIGNDECCAGGGLTAVVSELSTSFTSILLFRREYVKSI